MMASKHLSVISVLQTLGKFSNKKAPKKGMAETESLQYAEPFNLRKLKNYGSNTKGLQLRAMIQETKNSCICKLHRPPGDQQFVCLDITPAGLAASGTFPRYNTPGSPN